MASRSIAGFDWDDGNWPKYGKHGVSRQEIEAVAMAAETMAEDPNEAEDRIRFIGRNRAGRYVFVAATFRIRDGKTLIRPISARFMHEKEVRAYDRAKKAMAAASKR